VFTQIPGGFAAPIDVFEVDAHSASQHVAVIDNHPGSFMEPLGFNIGVHDRRRAAPTQKRRGSVHLSNIRPD
jgi:hypothetical protein